MSGMQRTKGKAGEEWRPVSIDCGKWAGKYEVSSHGRVRVSPLVKRRGSQPGRVLSVGVCNKGYEQISLQDNYRRKTVKVHRLVAAAFMSKPSPDHQVNHINGNKRDNAVANLEYVTNAENARHATVFLRDSWIVRGERMSVPEATKRYGANGVHEAMVRRRVNRLGWGIERALLTPPLPTGRPESRGRPF